MQNLVRYFTEGTASTTTWAAIGAEIETHFVDDRGTPISAETSAKLQAANTSDLPWGLTIDLGRQLFELQIAPCTSAAKLVETTQSALDWLYTIAAPQGAFPLHAPILEWEGPLLWEPNTQGDANAVRDSAFIQLDGRPALELLCRAASVQFTFDVNPSDAVLLLNALATAKLHKRDYPNDQMWRDYITLSRAGYTAERYGGPKKFNSIKDYAIYIARQPIIMQNGQICRPTRAIGELGDSHQALNNALRNVWNFYRLRRYGNKLTIEVRPFSRRGDDKIAVDLALLEQIVRSV